MKLTLSQPNHNPFIGIMVRSQHYFANWGHLVFIRGNGTIYLNVRKDDAGDYEDRPIGEIKGFYIKSFSRFSMSIDDHDLKIELNDFTRAIALTTLPYVFNAGRILSIAGYCRMGIRKVKVEEL